MNRLIPWLICLAFAAFTSVEFQDSTWAAFGAAALVIAALK
jgi:hypothetical protein